MELIDVSNVNGSVDWKRVRAAGVTGAWLKATEGRTFTDKLFATNRARANAAGVRVGAYHFARPDNHNTAVEEARHFCDVVGSLGRRDLKPAFDLEVASTLHPVELEAWAHKFCQEVTRRLGRTPVFYSYPAYITGFHPVKTIGNGLWLASYGTNNGARQPVWPPAPWKRYVAHQYTSTGAVPGVTGHVDRSHAARVLGVLAYPVRGLL